MPVPVWAGPLPRLAVPMLAAARARVRRDRRGPSTRMVLFNPHPIQVQALRIARRFQRGFRPTKVAGKPVPPASIFSKINFDSVPAFVLSAEIGHSTEYGDLIDDLCQRGYLKKHLGYPKCVIPRMEYMGEDGTRVYVHDEDWGEIDVLPPNAKLFRRHLGGFSGRVTLQVPVPAGAMVKPSKPTGKAPKVKRRGGSAAQGFCYELLPEGFKLLDEVEGAPDGQALTIGEPKQKQPGWQRLVIARSDTGDDLARLDGKEYRLTGANDATFLEQLQGKHGEPVLGTTLETQCSERPARIYDRLPRAIQRIIDKPGRRTGKKGYRML